MKVFCGFAVLSARAL